MPRLLTALFDARSAAERARAELLAAGVEADAVRVAGGEAPGGFAATLEAGVVQAFRNLVLPGGDRRLYEDGVRRGGYLLTVHADRDDVEEAIRIIEACGPVDLDARSRDWADAGGAGREASAGLTGSPSAAATGAGPGSLSVASSGLTPGRAAPVGGTTGIGMTAGIAQGAGPTSAETTPGMGMMGVSLADTPSADSERLGSSEALRDAEVAAEMSARRRDDAVDRESPMGDASVEPAATGFSVSPNPVTSHPTLAGGGTALSEAQFAAKAAPNPSATPALGDRAEILQRDLSDRAGRVRTYIRG